MDFISLANSRPPKAPALGQASPVISIDFADAETIRARKVVTRSRAIPTEKYPSWKVGRMIQCESPHELNAFRLLDANPAVRTFREQPCEIQYILDGEPHSHYPDALVELASGKELWEVKPTEEALALDVVRRTALLQEALPDFGFQYRVVLGEDLQKQPRLKNALDVLRRGRATIPTAERERLRVFFAGIHSFRWGAVLDGNFGRLGRKYICRLILEGKLTFDFEQPLTRESIIECTSNGRILPEGVV